MHSTNPDNARSESSIAINPKDTIKFVKSMAVIHFHSQ